MNPQIFARPAGSMLNPRNLIITIVATLILSVAAVDFLGPGIESPTPIGAYLNGIFPDQTPGGSASASVNYQVENAFPNLTFIDPVDMVELPGGKEFLVLGLQGHLWKIANNAATTGKRLVLDISKQTVVDTDGGMLGIVLHPEYGKANSVNAGYVYIFYRYTPVDGTDGTGPKVNGYMRLSRFTLAPGANTINPNSEYVLMQVFDRNDWHNGGDMFFGPDGFLYLAIGDEGSGNDAYGVTQQIDKYLFGGVLRIDVDRRGGSISHPIRRQPQNAGTPPSGWPSSFTQGYYIPNDNPWLDAGGGKLEEFYAIGARSPHRMTYDPPTGDIWIGDIGQGAKEEVSIVRKGENLQWPFREGDQTGPKARPATLIGKEKPPIHAYDRTVGRAVIGGFVYRGSRYPELKDEYLFGDHETQNVWTLKRTGSNSGTVEFLLHVPVHGSGSKDGISSFFVDSDDYIYILDLFATGQDGGVIRKLVREGGVPDPPEKLSDLGAFVNLQTLEPAPGIIPYDVNTPLWTDGAAKNRWIALPNNGSHNSAAEQIKFDAEGNWKFPAGTVLIKHFGLPNNARNPDQIVKMETRFLVFTTDGAYGLTYKWNDAGTEAYLIDVDEAVSRNITMWDANGNTSTQRWDYPTRQQCMQCHGSVAGYALGVKTRQLNKDLRYPSGITANQLETWNHLGMFQQDIGDPGDYPVSAPIGDTKSSEAMRVRSYMDANCSYCHRPNGVEGAFDGRSAVSLYDQALINTAVVSHASPAGAKIVVPGHASSSELWRRDRSTGPEKMPPLGRQVVDQTYINVLTSWINGLDPAGPATLPDGWYNLQAGHSGLHLGIEQAGQSDGQLAVQQKLTDGDHQKWYFQHMGNGKYRITTGHSNKVLSLNDLRPQRGAQVIQESWSDRQQQLWYLEDAGSGYYKLRNAYNYLDLDVYGSSTSENQWVITWTSHTAANQQWKAVPVDHADPCATSEAIALSELEWVSATNGSGTSRKNTNLKGGTMRINNKTYTSGIACHAQSEIVYDLNGAYTLFRSDIGVDETGTATSAASVRFEVQGDGRQLYSGPVMRATDDAISIEVNISGVQQLKLIVHELPEYSPGKDPDNSDHADWANARLESCGGNSGGGGTSDLVAIGEEGTTTADQNWKTVRLSNTYKNPVVIAGAPGYVESDQVTVRVRNVQAGSFEIRIDEWECLNEWHALETIPYLVVEAGTHLLPNGAVLQAGSIEQVALNWKEHTFAQPFAQEPVVLAQCVTDHEWEAVNVRIDQGGTDRNKIRLRLKEQDGAGSHAGETVSWIALDAGTGAADLKFEAGNSGKVVDHNWRTIVFDQKYSTKAVFIGEMGSNYGGDAAAVRYKDLTTSQVRVFVEEEKCGDSEINHAGEEIHYLVFDQPGAIPGTTIGGAQDQLSSNESLVMWLEMEALPESHRVRLDWEVDQEQEIATYVIERSVNGTEFMPVSDQPALGEDGELQYTGYDENPVIGDTYYRIRALGADGEELTSQTVKVTYAIPGATALVYPNPLHGAHTRLTVDLQLDLPEYVDFQIFSQDGRIIHREARDLAAGQSFVQFDLGSWPKGFYVLRMRGEQWDVVKRVVVQ
jgi:uncharacterized repeat protein (TIGR03806 family)